MSTRRHLLLGLFFVLVFSVLGYFTLFKTDFTLFGERYAMTVHFNQAGGLREGNSVMVAGMRWGKVELLTYDPDADPERRITVEVSLEHPIQLFNDHAIRIEDATVLGGKELRIEPGLAGSGALPAGAALFGEVSPNVMEALGNVVSENRDSLRNILSGLDDMVGDLREGDGVFSRLMYDQQMSDNLSKAVTSISATFQNAQQITSDLTQGQGTLGRLLYDEALYGQIESIAANLDGLLAEARSAVEDVRAGRGTVGALLYDDALRADVVDSMDRVASILDDVNQGRGTIGRLIKDGTIAENFEKLTSNLAEGRGTLGRLFAEDEVYDNLLAVSEDLRIASAALREGRGTIGKLLFEDDLYKEIEKAAKTLTGSLEEAREAAPISTFLNTVFLGF